MTMAITATVIGVGASAVMAKQGADAAKKAGRTAREQQLADIRAQMNEQKRANSAAENEVLLSQAQSLLAQRKAGLAFANASKGVSAQAIVPAAIGITAVSLAVFMLARKKK